MFITDDNRETIKKMSCVYNSFEKDNPELQIIETLKNPGDVFEYSEAKNSGTGTSVYNNVVNTGNYYVKAYNKSNNTTNLYKLKTNESEKLDLFLLNEYDDDLNRLETSKELNTTLEYNTRY
tara:strand:+ start:1525 stop:1890 length:366 start_codon:yes stop_codon:yes gene_type:complete